MESETTIVKISGGRPWGFSIKGGLENNKPLVISKLEKYGKAESGGLHVGDVLFCVNDIRLCGYRDEAVHLIRSARHILILEVERNALYRQAGVPLTRPELQLEQPKYDDYTTPPLVAEQKQYPNKYYPTMQTYPLTQYNANAFQTTSYITDRNPSPHEQYLPPPDGALYPDDFNPQYSGAPAISSYADHESNFRDDHSSRIYKSEYPSQPVVKLRTRKARDRGVTVERPRSWHDSKSTDFDISHQEDTMRSPESGYPYNSQPHHRLGKPKNRRSQGWHESGDLKSVYKPEIADSKDSLFSGGSQRSFKSARLSVSSSRSSGTISSSRGSVENLVEEGRPPQTDHQSYSQIVLSSGSKQFKHNSPSQPATGIVSQQRNIFERLSQKSASPGPEPKTFDFSNARRISSDSSDKKYRYSSVHVQEKSRSSSQSSGGSSRTSSVISPTASTAPAEKEKRKRTYEKTTVSPVAAKQDIHSRSLPRQKSSTIDLTRKGVEVHALPQDQCLTHPDVPQKENYGASKPFRNHHFHSKSYSALATLAYQDANSAPHFQYPFSKNLSQNSIGKPADFTSQFPTSHAGTGKHAANSDSTDYARAERVFGVVSTGKNGSVAAKSLTMPSKVKDLDSVSMQSEKAALSHHEFRNFTKNSDSRSTTPMKSENFPINSEHSKSVSADSNVKGKYGSIWKTPQTHRRARSTDFSSVLKEWSDRTSPPAEIPKMSVFDPIKAEEVKKVDQKEHQKTTNQNQTSNLSTSDLPSILKSLQNSANGPSLYQNLEPKSFTENYGKSNEKLKESTEITSTSIPWSKKKNAHNPFSDWKSQFKEVDLDELSDDSCSPQDRYVDDIKDMSKKVLRVTSFTRKDLGPSLVPVPERRKRFPHQNENQSLQPPKISHSRSRSHGSEIDENSDILSSRSEKKEDLAKPRPKSAGVSRTTNRHAPVLRATMAPPCDRPVSYYAGKSESLPRNSFSSHEWDDDMKSPTRSLKSPLNKTLETSCDSMASSPAVEKMNKRETRNAVIDFVSRKTGRSFDSDHSRYASPSSDEGEKRLGPTSQEKPKKKSPRSLRAASSGDSLQKILSTPVDHLARPEKIEVRKNVKRQLIEDGHTTHQQSSSSLVDEEEHLQRSDRTPSITSGERSTSCDNLTDSGLDMSRASPSEHFDVDHLSLAGGDEQKSPAYDPLTVKHELIKPPLRKHPKPHRQRYSNSSSASSATTISTLSSFSSASSTSIGRFPALGEESEQLGVDHTSHTPSTPLNDFPPKSTLPLSPLYTSSNRKPIDTGTYRVAKKTDEKCTKSPKIRSNYPETNIEIHQATKTIAVASCRDESDLSQDNKENKGEGALMEDQKCVSDVLTSKDALLEVQQNVCEIIEKVKKSASLRDPKANKRNSAQVPLPPPPKSLPYPLDDAAEQLLEAIAHQRKLPAPPEPCNSSVPSSVVLEKIGNHNKSPTQDLPARLGGVTTPPDPSTTCNQRSSRAPTDLDSYKEITYLVNSDSESQGTSQIPNISEVIPKSSEQHFKPIHSPLSASPQTYTPPPQSLVSNHPDLEKESGDASAAEAEQKELPLVSPVPLLPDVSLFPDSVRTSLQEDHPELTQDIIQGDKALAQIFSTNNKKTSDYMEGILTQPSYDIIEQGMRYRRRKPFGLNFEFLEPNNNHVVNDLHRHNLPASSTYYKTSASKGKILSLMKEKLADGEIQYQEEETCDEMNRKKLELILSIKSKLDDLDNMKGLLDVEMKENESLGKQVCNITKNVCTPKEQEKYNIFVQDVDKIINLLLSLSGRLARVENAIQMLPADAEKQEMDLLCEKRRKLTEQHKEAKQLKENIDRRQKIVSEILVKHLNREQFADYEHYIKMKSALIMEQRELDDKTKLGREQMQCLRDSLPEEWQSNLDKLIGE